MLILNKTTRTYLITNNTSELMEFLYQACHDFIEENGMLFGDKLIDKLLTIDQAKWLLADCLLGTEYKDIFAIFKSGEEITDFRQIKAK